MRAAAVFLALLLVLAAGILAGLWASDSGSASPGGSLSCVVKPSCTGSEVEVFRMSSLANAHAGSSYTNKVCCSGVSGLGSDCGATPHAVVLSLSATDNAHVASDDSYANDVCLSGAEDATVDCTYDTTCDTDYACLATISGSSNAHVADCYGTNDYTTKVCCLVTEDNCPGVSNPGQENADGDQWGDACDNCPNTATVWYVPSGDGDCDGFTTTDENYYGTWADDACADNETDDAWPVDIAIDTSCDVGDILMFKPHIMQSVPPAPQRYDLAIDQYIDVGDILMFKPFIMLNCTNP